MIIVTDLSHPFLTDFVFIREGFLFFFCNGLYLRRDSSFFSPDYVDSQRDLFLPRTSPKEKVFHYEWYSSLFYTSCLGFRRS